MFVVGRSLANAGFGPGLPAGSPSPILQFVRIFIIKLDIFIIQSPCRIRARRHLRFAPSSMPALYASIPSPAPSATLPCQSRDLEVAEIIDEIRRLEACLGGPADSAACFTQIVSLLHDLRNRVQIRELRRFSQGRSADQPASSYVAVQPSLQQAG
jgi:hypothetical protein